ncbi:MAG: c-type cytochrome biogenesis protein CcsB [Chloroflexota bacterium]
MVASIEYYSIVVAMGILGLSAVFLLVGSTRGQAASAEKPAGILNGVASLGLLLKILGLVLLTASLAARAAITGHGPFSNMYEFCLAFAWGILMVSIFFWWRHQTNVVNAFSVVLATGLLVIAYFLPSRHAPLVPALQQSFLLSSHVAAAAVAYGSFAMGFVSALLYVWQQRHLSPRLPRLEVLDDISHHAVIIGFPFMTLVIVLGALWADVAWGRYWGWDPKETVSLVTWLIYAAYLHARILRGWRGTRAAVLLIVGFCAVLFTFFGNYVFSGLHSYL